MELVLDSGNYWRVKNIQALLVHTIKTLLHIITLEKNIFHLKINIVLPLGDLKS